MSKVQIVSVISFLSFSVIVGCLVFSRGFLLNRQIIPEKSSPCWNQNFDSSKTYVRNHSAAVFESTLRSLSSASLWCSSAPTFPKMILILVDALRFDFVSRMKFLSKVTNLRDNQYGASGGVSSCLFKFIADPPTTTMQRLKALMTGTMPTFIDASANFNSYEIEEDSLIYQLYAAGKRIGFLGDDTWLGLFPQKFFTSFVEAFPSFNAWDLDTVDRGINSSLRQIFSSTNERRDDWDVIIAHLLGVDHCGHRYGPNHPEMIRKLDEADAIIEHVFKSMDHNTLLVIFGDHGMTNTGDHGGDSLEETESSLIFLTKQLKRNKQLNPLFHCPSEPSNIASVSQIDLVPTLSAFMGIPIPYSSIGQIIPNFLLNKTYSYGIAANVAQVQKYIQRFSSSVSTTGGTSGFFNFKKTSTETTSNNNNSNGSGNIFEQYEKVEEAFMEYQSSRNPTTRGKLHELAQDYLNLVKSIATTTWTQFDVPMIYTGIFITALASISLTVYLININKLLRPYSTSDNKMMSNNSHSHYSVLEWLWPSLPHWSVVSTFISQFNTTTGLLAIIISTFSGLGVFLFILLFKVLRLPQAITTISSVYTTTTSKTNTSTTNNTTTLREQNLINNNIKSFFIDISEIGSILLYAFTCLAVFSNSFLINEGYVLGSVLLMVVLLHIITSKGSLTGLTISIETDGHEDNILYLPLVKGFFKCSWISFAVFAIILRTGTIFFRCREELTECREEYLLHKQLSSLPEDMHVHKYVRYSLALLSLAVFAVVFRHWMMYRKCMASSRACCVIAKFIPSILVVLLGVFWALQGLPFATTYLDKVKPILSFLPITFQMVAVISLIIIWFKPLCCIGKLRPPRWRKNYLSSSATTNNSTTGQFSKQPTSSLSNKSTKQASPPINNSSNKRINSTTNNGLSSQSECNGVANGIISSSTHKFVKDEEDTQWLKQYAPDTLSEDVFSSTLLTHGVLVTLLLVQVTSAGNTPAITCLAYACVCLVIIYRNSSRHDTNSWSSIIAWTLASQYFFYATGHQPVFSAIPWDSVFLGNEGNNLASSTSSWLSWIRPALSVVGNLHVSQIIMTICLPLLAFWKGDTETAETLMGHSTRKRAFIMSGKYIALHGFKLLTCMCCAGWHRRHLMVWKIFAPKFIFEAVSFIVTSSVLTLLLVFITRIDYAFQKVTKEESTTKRNKP